MVLRRKNSESIALRVNTIYEIESVLVVNADYLRLKQQICSVSVLNVQAIDPREVRKLSVLGALQHKLLRRKITFVIHAALKSLI